MAKRKRRRDPLADHIEWNNNRNNPGHYLGGNIHPDSRLSTLGPKGRRAAGVVLAISAGVGVVAVAVFSGKFPPRPFLWRDLVVPVLVTLILGWVALAMLRTKKPRARGSRRGKRRGSK